MNRHERRQALTRDRRFKSKNPMAIHELVAATAMSFAGAAYDVLASGNNEWYAANPSHKEWVMRRWSDFVPQAREKLVDMLTMPSVSDTEKEVIADALMHDGALNPPPEHTARLFGASGSVH